jgi:major membrane immunogen (membrane-anchored lipoprotein)
MPVSLNLKTAWYVAYHADESFTQHATLLEAHDALVESGSPSPFEVVTGSAVETPQTHA